METITTVTTGSAMPKKIAILDYSANIVTIKAYRGYDDSESVRSWLSRNDYNDDCDYMVGDFELIIDN